MNGSGSNTSGNAVAQISSIPRGLFGRLLASLGLVVQQLNQVQDGEATLAVLDFMKAMDTDRIDNDTMAEIVRRLVVTLEGDSSGNGGVIFQPTAPSDTTKVWWQTDPTTNLPVLLPQVWDATLEKWVSIVPNAEEETPITLPVRQFVQATIAQGAGNVVVTLPADMGGTDYFVSVTPTTYVSSAWQAAPANLNSFGFVISSKTSNQVTINYYGVPSGGLNLDIMVEENPS